MTKQSVFKTLHIFSAIMVNLLLPGAGFVWLGYYKKALLIQSLFWISAALMCWSLWVFSPIGIKSLLLIFVAIYLINSLYLCLILFVNKHPKWQTKPAIWAIIFTIVGLASVLGGFISKHHWLGIHIYFVPSMSMQPTLFAGDYILVDTWLYQSLPPAIEDIIIFSQTNDKTYFVKRVQPWPSTLQNYQNQLYVLGDNRNHSKDSRVFGGVELSQVRGKVRLVLVSLSDSFTPVPKRWFLSVK